MSLKIPPVVVMAVHMVLVWLAAKFVPAAEVDIPFQKSIVQVLGVAGVTVAMIAIGLFRRAKTTVDPMQPNKAEQLVISGIYKFTRNPMYLGMALILAAWIVMKSNILGFVCLFSCIWYLTQFQIKPEERFLEEKFGQDYLVYKRKVRRWL